jgi:ribonucleoside-diphosphate reductase alpha chain
MFSREEAVTASLEYFNGDELAADVFVDKYALRNSDNKLVEKTPDDMHRRLAKEFARIEKKYPSPMSETEIYELFKDFKYVVPQGSPMSSIGNYVQVQSHSNCFVIERPYDSYAGILYTDQQQAQIMKRRGGVGFDISSIRPKGLPTKNAAGTTDGIAVFMDRFSNTCREVAQCIAEGQRVLTKRGLIPIESVISNKDFVWTRKGWKKVINVFHNGQKKVFKVSAKDGLEIITSAEHVFLSEENGNLVEKRIKDFKTSDKIILLPGTARDRQTGVDLKSPEKTKGELTFPKQMNPELAYLLGTMYGDGSVRYRVSKTTNERNFSGIDICCSHDWPTIFSKIKVAVKNQFNYDMKVYEKDGATAAFIFSKQIVEWLNTNNILKQKTDYISVPEKIFEADSASQIAFLAGLLDSDGHAKKTKYRWNTNSEICAKQIQTLLMANGIYSKRTAYVRGNGKKTTYTVCVYGKYGQTNLHLLMRRYSEKVSTNVYISGIDHLLTPFKQKDGKYFKPTKYLSAKTINPELFPSEVIISSEIKEITPVGCKETYDLQLESEHLFWCEGFYVHNSGRRGALMITIDCHHPEIETFISIKRDLKRVTGANISIRWSDEFLQAVENNQDVQLRWPVEKEAEHKLVKNVNAKEIWQKFVESAHFSGDPGCLFWDTALQRTPSDCYKEHGFESVSTNPCGEIILSVADSCRLICVNTLTFVKDPYTAKAMFDFDEFKLYVGKAQKLMDDMIDLELEAIDRIIAKVDSDPEPEEVKKIEKDLWTKIKESAYNGRRTGLGVTAIGDTVAACGLIYGSKESIEFVEEIYKALSLGAYKTTVQLAAERGAFPIFSFELEKGHPFLEQIWEADPELYEQYKRHGRRNIALTTTAPTGSVSVMTQTTSGIEPVFMTHYKRRKKINPHDTSSKVDFVDDLGDKWQEYTVYHHGVKRWMEVSGESDITLSPYNKATANEIDWEGAVMLQAAAQKWICHAISKTINLPNDAKVEDVQKVYWMGWKSGCKGITVYRDGSKSGVLVSDTEKEKRTSDGRPIEIVVSHAPKRPESLNCEIHNVKIAGQQWVVIVGMLKDKPYELFAGKAENLVLPKRAKEGKIIKIRRGVYDLHIGEGDDELIVKNIIKAFDNPEMAWTTRLISMALRHGIDCSYVQMQLDKDGLIADINKVLARVIKKYIIDGKLATGVACKSCGSSNVVFAEGCLTCVDCGSSKCG